jgi:hypothetical protein
MKAWIWLRGLAVILGLFAAGHTMGTAAPHVTRGVREAATFDAMQSFQFPIMGFDRTYWDFYRGFALTISVLQVAMAVMAWQAGTITKSAGRAALPMAVTLQCVCIGLLVLSCLFFFGGPIVFSAVAVLVSTIAVFSLAREPAVR